MQKKSAKLALIIFFSFQTVKADVLINEICWTGDESSNSNEWIELYNNGDKNIDLNNWQIKVSQEKIIDLKGIIPSQGFYLLSRNKNQTGVDLIFNKALNNKGEKIELIDNKESVIDSADFSGGWNYGNNETKQTMERVPGGWQTSLNNGGTPKKANILIEKPLAEVQTKKESNNYFTLFSLFTSFVFGGIVVFVKNHSS